jgi:hypothetical protein
MTTEERVLRLENAFATLSEMVAQEASRTDAVLQLVREHDERMKAEAARTDTLLQLVRDHDERLVEQTGWINSLGSGMAELTAAQQRTEETVNRLAERVDKLAETVERYVSEGRDGHN